jgi:outer membrane lipoprotein-sorting protein
MKMKRRVKARKKWIILSILMLISLLLVWGCGGNGDADEPETEQPSQGEETPDTPDAEEPEQEEEGEEQGDQEGLSDEELADLFENGKDMDEFFYEMNVSGMGEEDTTTGIYIKGKLMRIEGEAMGQRFMMIYNEDAFYTLDPQSKTAIKMPMGMEDEEDRDTPTLDDFTQDVDENSMNYVGKETINGVSCHVVESKNLNSDYQVKMWLHEEYGFPMRVESKMENDEIYISEVTDFQVGNISDDLFEIPEDYEVVDLGSMIPGAP